MMMRFSRLLLLPASLAVAACAVGPDYTPPALPTIAEFKEGQGWEFAKPADMAPRGRWWEVFCDATLNRLALQAEATNLDIIAAEARYRQAQAVAAQARSGLFPAIDLNGGFSRGRGANSGVGNNYNGALGASWEPDLWGRIRRSVEAGDANEQASEADALSARLSAQAELATNYINLRVADEQKRLLDDTIRAYERSYALTENLYNAGVEARSSVLQAKVQLESARAQAVNVQLSRSAYEHAIAVLVGQTPSQFSIPPVSALPALPTIPAGLPSSMLQRRPDIAAAERRTAAANANIGVARAAFFPQLTLSASIGYAASAMGDWFTSPSRIWSLGPSVAQTVFDAGLRRAQTDEAIAAYDETVATYRQTVLTAFQEVEDNLSALRTLEEEEAIRQAALRDARESTAIFLNQYQAGTSSYLNVVTAQTTELNNALSALSVRRQRLVYSVSLIRAIGGEWGGVAQTPAPASGSVQLTPPTGPAPASR